jgi:predicted 2-oxoglutarate/Fe(II)-dependent dioxygenase YbiX
MNLSLLDYIKVYPSLSLEECNSVIDSTNTLAWQQHSFYLEKEKSHKSHENDLEVTWSENQDTQFLQEAVWKCLHSYICEDLNFSWFKGWSAFTNIRFNRYTTDSAMLEHCDHIHDIFDGENKGIPVLSIVGLLNKDFEGGDLVFFNHHKVKVSAGDIVIFPSNFLYPHKVTTITNGIRYSFVSWAW